LLTGIERVQEGVVRWGGIDLAGLTERDRDAWRLEHVGLVFQDFHLVPGLSILANVLVTGWFDRWRPEPALVARAQALLDGFSVPTAGREVTDLSRGEQQRVAIARALLREPVIVVADEPTASLDATGGALVIELLLARVRATGATILAVTHDPALIEACAVELHLEHGRLDRRR
jgi:putative ABC transport system ATP-binding protein